AGGSTPGTSGPPTARLRLASPAQPADKLVRATRGGVAQPGRALPSHGRGRRFKSAHLHSPRTQALLGFSVSLGVFDTTPARRNPRSRRDPHCCYLSLVPTYIRWNC